MGLFRRTPKGGVKSGRQLGDIQQRAYASATTLSDYLQALEAALPEDAQQETYLWGVLASLGLAQSENLCSAYPEKQAGAAKILSGLKSLAMSGVSLGFVNFEPLRTNTKVQLPIVTARMGSALVTVKPPLRGTGQNAATYIDGSSVTSLGERDNPDLIAAMHSVYRTIAGPKLPKMDATEMFSVTRPGFSIVAPSAREALQEARKFHIVATNDTTYDPPLGEMISIMNIEDNEAMLRAATERLSQPPLAA